MELRIEKLRDKLDRMSRAIVNRLSERGQYRLNEQIYKPGAHPLVKGKPISLLELRLDELEQLHATWGRFNFPEQQPLFGHFPPHIHKRRKYLQTPVAQVKIDTRKDIVPFYVSSLIRFCELGEDPTTYGETAYHDADLVLRLNERINLGRVIAESKLHAYPELIVIHDEKELEKELRVPEQEQRVLERVRELANSCSFPANLAEDFFRWIIDETVKVEVAYVRQRQRFPD